MRDNSIQGPYLVIVVIGQYPEAHGYAPLRAYAQPIYSGVRFIPVESNFERAVLQALLRSRRVLAREGVDLALEKPIFDRLTPLGACRPDFLVEARSQATGEIRQLVIQAMPRNAGIGSTPATQRALEQIAPALPITPRDVEDDQVARLIAEALHRLN